MKNNRALIITLIVVVSLFICAFIFIPPILKSNGGSTGDVPRADLSQIDINTLIPANEYNGGIADHVKGDITKAEVVIYEYADYQCSACSLFATWMSELIDEYDGKFAVVFRVYPITTIHPNAIAAASAVEAAGLQGYWEEYGDLLFANQSEWASASGTKRTNYFVTYFNTISGGNGDPVKFKEDMEGSAVKAKITFDKDISEYLGFNATPTFLDSEGNEIDFSERNGVEQSKTGIMNFFRNYINSKLQK